MVTKIGILNAVYNTVHGEHATSHDRERLIGEWSKKLKGVRADDYATMERNLGISLNMFDTKQKVLKHATSLRRPQHVDLLVNGNESVTSVVVSRGGKEDDDKFYTSLFEFGTTSSHQFNV